MRFITGLVLFALITISISCSRLQAIPTEFPEPYPPAAPAPIGKISLHRDRMLEKQIAEIAETGLGKTGVAAVLLETGDAAIINGDELLPMQSVYKLPIVMAVLNKVRRGQLSLDEQVGVTPADFVRPGVRSPLRNAFPQGGVFTLRELATRAMIDSDGTASDVLLGQAGGPSEVMDYLSQIGVHNVNVLDSEKQIFVDWDTQFRNSASALGIIDLLRALYAGSGMTPADHDFLINIMSQSEPGTRRIKRFLPKGTVVAHKTGTGGFKDGVFAATNDAGIIYLPGGKHILLSAFITSSTAKGFEREKAIADIAKLVYDSWVNR